MFFHLNLCRSVSSDSAIIYLCVFARCYFILHAFVVCDELCARSIWSFNFMSRNVPVLHENMLFGPAMASDEDDTVWQNAHIYTDTHRVFVDGDLMREKHFHARDCD